MRNSEAVGRPTHQAVSVIISDQHLQVFAPEVWQKYEAFHDNQHIMKSSKLQYHLFRTHLRSY